MNKRLLMFALIVSFATACGKSDKEKTDNASTAARDTVASSPVAVTYRAFGNEPFWSVTINDAGLHYISPDDTAGIHFPSMEPMVMGDTLHWASKSDRGAIDVRIWPGACSDGMSDETWSYGSSVRLNETLFVGCAEKTMGDGAR